MSKSWKPVWKIHGEGNKWCGNAQRFATEAEAKESAHARFMVWTATTDFSALPSDDPVNYERVDGYDQGRYTEKDNG